ncbi:MAG TPA: hypothetical protein VJ937_09230 [Salinivirga sp.]|uniref:hypothetical protein n=1 Tax=Salinivirga sp. TaxID=1970192 RepID=UPI002B45C304|nr:hypothetical protein [Salinivirga sp.]HKK59648.1 hypothetical protein [Salinivirga sp.]
MKKILIPLLAILVTIACDTSETVKEKAFMGNEWTIGDEILFRNDSSVSYKKFDNKNKKMVGDTTFPIKITDSTITYKLIKGKGHYNENRQYVLTGDTLIETIVGYDFTFINEEPKLILYAENYPKVCSSKKSDIKIKPTNHYKQVKFTIAKYSIGDRIDRDLLKTRGIYNYDTYTIEDCELKTNHDIKIKIIGYNQIYAIERHNIPQYRVEEIKEVVTSKMKQEAAYVPMRQLSEKSDYAYEFYRWSKNGVRIKLERSRYIGDYAYMNLLDSDTWTLYYDDDVQKALLIEQHKKSKPHSTIIN